MNDARQSGGRIHLIAGSTGAGKTTYAIALSRSLKAVRFSIDEWMTTLFWMDSPQPIQYDWTLQRLERCEAVIWAQVVQLAALGIGSVLDLGFTRAAHRGKFAELAAIQGLDVQLHLLNVPPEQRWARVSARNRERGETYRMDVDRGLFDFMDALWEPPSQEEMAGLNGVHAQHTRTLEPSSAE